MEQVDGVEPECRKGLCPIPSLDGDGARTMALWSAMESLKDIVPAESILSRHGATRADLELLAVLPEFLRGPRDGD